ncbi:PilZ domain-containing protein [Marinobacter confluentis]|nr:PilZ domain-containing protein [Marinobacter confluentis]
MSDIDYSFGNEDDPSGSADNRSEYRLAGSAQVTLELESRDPESTDETPARNLSLKTRDLSAQGFSVITREPLLEHALLRAWIKLEGEAEPFQLTVDVVWCRPGAGGEWLVGLRILESDDTAYLEWAEAVARAMSED